MEKEEKKQTFFLDDQEISFKQGQDILEASLKAGKEIPHFCMHLGLSRVATCRMCLVDITDAGNGRPIPKLQTSCSTPASSGMKVVTKNSRVKEAREAVMEFLLINHPLDCPICDQSGECKLQDFSFDYGSGTSNVSHSKRVYGWRDIGTFLQLERNRCIHCTRCVRFTQEITGTCEMGTYNRNHQLTVDTFIDKPLTDLFQGNLADICPVGAITAKDFRFKKRVWKLAKTPSVCNGCSTGCNIDICHYKGEVYRFIPRENQAVNQWWMCDPGRISFHPFLDHKKRLKTCLVKGKKTKFEDAIQNTINSLTSLELKQEECLVIGSNHSTLEEAYALKVFSEEHLNSPQLFATHFNAENNQGKHFIENLITNDDAPNSRGLEEIGFNMKINEEFFKNIDSSKIKCCILVGNAHLSDLFSDLFKSIPLSIYLTKFEDELSKIATISFSIASSLEKNGTFMNKNKRLQKNRQAIRPLFQSKPENIIFEQIAEKLSSKKKLLQKDEPWLKKLANEHPTFKILQTKEISSLGLPLS